MQYFLTLTFLCFTVILPGCDTSNSSYVARVLAIHDIHIRGEIASAIVLSEDSSDLGRSGHKTVRLLLTDVGFDKLLQRISRSDGPPSHSTQTISGFGNTMTSASASHTYFSQLDGELLVIFADEASKTAEVVIAW